MLVCTEVNLSHFITIRVGSHQACQQASSARLEQAAQGGADQTRHASEGSCADPPSGVRCLRSAWRQVVKCDVTGFWNSCMSAVHHMCFATMGWNAGLRLWQCLH